MEMGRVLSGALLCLAVGACGSPTDAAFCSDSLALSFESCFTIRDGAALGPGPTATLELEVERTLSAVNDVMPLSGVEIDVIVDATRVIPEIGIGGFAESGSRVLLFVDPGRADLGALLEREIMPMLAHELHHVKRMRSVGYGSTLVQAAITEGLADHFSIEISGIAPPLWSVALVGAELETWTERLLSESDADYDHSRWFFGVGSTVPRWTGYAVGFGLVDSYLMANGTRRPSDLFDEPAESFVPR